MKVIVDADACPRKCLQFLKKESVRHKFRLLTVASFNHIIENDDHLVVGNEADAVDLVVANNVNIGDIAVTQDLGLGALILAKGGYVLTPTGKQLTNENVDILLEERSLKAKVRRGGGKTKGPSARTKADDENFQKSFQKLYAKLVDL